jgi:short-subunit dehydrogenase
VVTLSEQRRTALITGATAGIGAAFARHLAADGYDLVLVARDGDRLAARADELTTRYGVHVEALPADLSTDDGPAPVAERLANPGRPVHLLVNNAGIGLKNSFLRNSVEDEARLLRLNIGAVMCLTHAALSPMVVRKAGAVINVSSVAGFGPINAGSTYAASKAWVTNFSESVAQSTVRHNVRVMALCPGFTRTEFHERAGIDTHGSPEWMWLDADNVVAAAMRDLARGRSVSVPNWKYKAAALGIRFTPHSVFTAMGRRTRRPVSRTEV